MSAKPKIIPNTPEEEARIQAGIALDTENPEWTEDDLKNAVPFDPCLPPFLPLRRMTAPDPSDRG